LELYFVTGNKHKFEEVKALISKLEPSIQLKPLSGVRKLEIQASALEKIALFAAEDLSRKIGVNFFIEDAGLFIDALRGFPGPYSHYVYKTIGCEGILKLMEGISNRNAEFRSVIALSFGGIIKIFRGVVRGTISTDMRGEYGFGFDPIFIPEGSDKTFAEMKTEEKNRVSHRARSVRSMIEFIRTIMR